MELLSAIPVIGGALGTIVPFLIVLGIVVFVHEFGHYIVGRWCGIRAEVFSIGFGPKLWGWSDRRGTHWQVAALPLGGYVRFVGDMDPASAGKADDADLTAEQRAHAFHNASLWRRAATVAAGPVFNFALSFVLFVALSLAVGKASNDPVIGELRPELAGQVDLQPGDRVLEIDGEPVETFGEIISAFVRANGEQVDVVVERGDRRLTVPVAYRLASRIDFVNPGMPASRAGLVAGDVIVEVDGEPVASFYDLQVVTATKALGEEIVIDILRDDVPMTFRFMPDIVERTNPVTREIEPLPTIGVRAIGLGGINPTLEARTLGEAMLSGVAQTVGIVTGTFNYVGDMIFADADTGQLGGPIRIAQISGEKAEEGFMSFAYLIAIISTSIGLLNLFPVPVLDGGHLMFYAFEAIRGRPVGDFAIRVGTMIGLSLVLLLMVFATYNDLARL
ncbi:RIP metalloprotease RseP [Limibaculum sp. M0105]|uniref:Zinc metalloprotease n=1 Tax=Thermohalobaculum xanthum TaxID=2753746 RepID=A0A8J7M790_9RHOB|nr:RIP metalloprotease RseP [Thermohalobaculum xanthum]MBK0398829.1 RIP metalloprotease RseP [Thermohalobaculum xanthum]